MPSTLPERTKAKVSQPARIYGEPHSVFQLHPTLAKDCIALGHFELCRLLLMNDANFPWFILVPEREGVQEIFQLSQEDQTRLILESSHLARHLAKIYAAHKLNVAALGNLVPQLHIHHIVRYRGDPAWPQPVWGKMPPTPYDPAQLEGVRQRVAEILDAL